MALPGARTHGLRTYGHQPQGAGRGGHPGDGPPAACPAPGGAGSSGTAALHCPELPVESVSRDHLTKMFWNTPPPTTCSRKRLPDNRSPGGLAPEPVAGPGLASLGQHQAAIGGRGGPGAQQVGQPRASRLREAAQTWHRAGPQETLHRGRSNRISTNI